MTTGTFLIRSATERDEPGILECLQRAFARYQSDYTAEAFRDTVLSPATIRNRMRTMHVLVAVSESNAVVGTLAFQATPEGGHLRGMAVLPEFQQHGIAWRLLGRAERSLLELGCDRVILETTAPLQRAAEFYRQHGFQPTGKTRDFFGMELTEWAKPITLAPHIPPRPVPDRP